MKTGSVAHENGVDAKTQLLGQEFLRMGMTDGGQTNARQQGFKARGRGRSLMNRFDVGQCFVVRFFGAYGLRIT